MDIYRYKNGQFKLQKSLSDSIQLDLAKKNIISVVGAGGKTSTVYQLGQEMTVRRCRPVITTTTHMRMPKQGFIDWSAANRMEQISQFHDHGIIPVAGVRCGNEKICGIPKQEHRLLSDLAGQLIVEADGARGLSFKVPNEQEPVIFTGTNVTIGIIGADCFGKAIAEIAHRPAATAAFLDKRPADRLSVDDGIWLINSSQGLGKGRAGQFYVLINKMPVLRKPGEARRIADILMHGCSENLIYADIKIDL